MEDKTSTMVAGAVAGSLARVPLFPLDLARARIGVRTDVGGPDARGGGLVAELRRTARAEGVRGLYRGFLVTFAASAPGSCLYFTAYETIRAGLGGVVGGSYAENTVVHLAAGFLAEAVSCVVFTPLDVVKERMQVEPAVAVAGGGGGRDGGRGRKLTYAKNATARDVVRDILSTSGVRGLYRGYGATLASFGPFSALYLATYEELRRVALAWGAYSTSPVPVGGHNVVDVTRPPPAALFWTCGALAGGFAGFLTNALDLVKLRAQTGGFAYRGVVDGLRTLVQTEGPVSLLRGSSARVAFSSLAAALNMALFESVRLRLAGSLWL